MEKEKLRLDKYLWSIRLFKTRSLATDACNGNQVKMNDEPLKASRNVKLDEVYEVKTKERRWIIKVTGLLNNRKAYSEAIKYYEDLTPVEDTTRIASVSSSFYTGKRPSKIGRPTKKDRRDLDDLMNL